VTVGFYSPLPPARTGVAAYASALLAALARFGPVQVNSRRADVRLYHLGNNQLHRDIYRQALLRPGAVVLHDAVLNHFFLGSLDRDSYLDEFTHNYGEWSRGLAQELWSGRTRSAQDPRYFQYGMLKRVAARSRLVIVHNPAAAKRVAAQAPKTRVVEIPHLFCPPALPALSQAMRFRQQSGLGPRTFLFGVFGHLRESKRLPAVLRAFQAVRRTGAGVALLVAGELASADLARAVAPLLAGPGILRAGYAPEHEFWKLASATDACINLRYPPAGETSGIAIRLMGIGKPVLVTTGEETSRFPQSACLRVDPGPAEVEMLTACMLWLARSPQAAREIGRRAAEHIGRRHALEAVAAQYWDALEQARV
jgi:glycosyltransferase involved in cell wall biosynthesis